MRWRGPIGPSFVADITGVSRTDLVGVTDPRAWALDLLGFPMGTAKVTKKDVMAPLPHHGCARRTPITAATTPPPARPSNASARPDESCSGQ